MTQSKNHFRALTQNVVKIEEQIERLQRKLRVAELAKAKEEERLVAIMNAGRHRNIPDTVETGTWSKHWLAVIETEVYSVSEYMECPAINFYKRPATCAEMNLPRFTETEKANA